MFSHGFNPVDVFFQVIVLLFAICVRESARAWAANRLGDPTGKMLGRISLNPIVHIDPFGTILVPLIMIVIGWAPFGWGKPVPVDNRNFKNVVRDDILAAIAGPLSNLLTALLAVIALAILLRGTAAGVVPIIGRVDVANPMVDLFSRAIEINVLLAVFNLIPLPPLDASQVVRHFLSYQALQTYDRFGNIALMLLIFVLPMIGFNLIGILTVPFTIFFQALLALFLGFR
ncbi:MAG TPA: site-2 protease family protein [Terriglobales bacterium]|jgi:Zn-dependent protease